VKQTSKSIAISKRQFIGAVGAVSALTLSPSLLMAQTPGVIKLIIPYGPGGPTDVVARLVSTQLQTILKQTVIVENKPGAGSAIGARFVANSPADGRTILIGNVSTYAIAPATMKNPGYDPVKSFAPIVQTSDICSVMVTGTSFPANTVQEFVTYARANPGKISYGSAGIGNSAHLLGELLQTKAQLNMVHVPYRSGAEMSMAVLSGQVQFAMTDLSASIAQIREGKLKALAVTTPQRMTSLPQVPTVAEVAIPGFSYSLWGGLFAPADTPAAVVQSLNKEVNAILASPDIRARFDADNLSVPRNTPAEFAEYVRNEAVKFEKLVKEANLKAE
jgi:tripartite-type tricarboxylate transporter receptor subunit TctC